MNLTIASQINSKENYHVFDQNALNKTISDPEALHVAMFFPEHPDVIFTGFKALGEEIVNKENVTAYEFTNNTNYLFIPKEKGIDYGTMSLDDIRAAARRHVAYLDTLRFNRG